MTNLEALEAYGRYRAAGVAISDPTWATVDHGYDPIFEPSSPSMGTVTYRELPSDKDQERKVSLIRTVAGTAVLLTFGSPPRTVQEPAAAGIWSDPAPADNQSGGTIDSGAKADSRAVVRYARQARLGAIAAELEELFKLPQDDGEKPLHPRAALNFTKYCVARRKARCPLITVTPDGNLDVTWTDAGGERVIMRFFENGTVWVALKLARVRGSLELAARDLAEQSHQLNLPNWA